MHCGVKDSILSDDVYNGELLTMLKFVQMAVPLGAKSKESQEDIVKKLNSNGQFLQNSTSTLQLEMEILNKLIYKMKNTHNKEKFFKCLERIKKCVTKWKFLSLDKKLIEMCKHVGEVNNLHEILEQIMLGGQLATRVIILCQETVQYCLAYLARGFFVTLHVTLLSLVSRIWVLQKDCWTGLVESYRLILSLVQRTTGSQTNVNQFPECLTVWLSEDVNRIFDGRDTTINVVKSSNPILQQLFRQNEDINDSYTASTFEDDVNHDEVDLGEPVETTRELYFEDRYSTPKLASGKAASEPKTNLRLKFDLEHAGCESFCENERSEQLLKNRTLKRSRKVKADYTLYYRDTRKSSILDKLGKSDHKLVVTRRKRSIQSRNNSIFIEKTPCRYTLRNLLAKEDFSDCSRKHLHVVFKILRFALYSQIVLPSERKILLRIQSSLQKELVKRKLVINNRDEVSFPRKTDMKKEYPGTFQETHKERPTDFELLDIDGKTIKDGEKYKILRNPVIEEISKTNKPCFLGVYNRRERQSRVSPINLKSGTFFEKDQKNRLNQNEEIDRDEIDAIFSSLGV